MAARSAGSEARSILKKPTPSPTTSKPGSLPRRMARTRPSFAPTIISSSPGSVRGSMAKPRSSAATSDKIEGS